MELEHSCWYWVAHPGEDDIFYPVYVLDDEYLMLNGNRTKINMNNGAIFTKAVMPIKGDRI